jgi:hypothetical protein
MVGDQFTSVHCSGMNCPFEVFYLPILLTALHFVTRSGMHGAPLRSHIYTFMGAMNLETNSSVAMQNTTDVVVEDGRRGL